MELLGLVGINRNELLAYRDMETLQDFGLHRLHVLSQSSLHNRRLDTCVTTRLLANFIEGQRAVRYWHSVETVGSRSTMSLAKARTLGRLVLTIVFSLA